MKGSGEPAAVFGGIRTLWALVGGTALDETERPLVSGGIRPKEVSVELVAVVLRFLLNSVGLRGTSASLLPISSSRLGVRRILDMKPRRPAPRGAAGEGAEGLAGDCTVLLEADEAGNLKSGEIPSRGNVSVFRGCRIGCFAVGEEARWG